MATRTKPHRLPMTEPRVRIATMFTAHDSKDSPLKLTDAITAKRAGVAIETARSALNNFVHTGWFAVEWENVDPANGKAGAPRRLFFLRDGQRQAVIRRVSEYHKFKERKAMRKPRAPRVPLVCAPPRPEDDEPLSEYKPDLGTVPKGQTGRAVLGLFLKDPKASLATGDVAVALERSASTVHQVLDVFEHCGFLASTYAPSPVGRSRRLFTLTAAGVAAAERVVGAR